MRVYEAAKKYKLANDELIKLLGKAGFPVKSHMSGMTDDMISFVEREMKALEAAKPKVKPKAKAVAAKTKKPRRPSRATT